MISWHVPFTVLEKFLQQKRTFCRKERTKKRKSRRGVRSTKKKTTDCSLIVLHATPRITTRRIVPRELPSNAKYCHSQRSVGTKVKYKRHTAMSIHAWRPSSAQSTRGQIDCSYFPPSRRGLIRSPIPSSDIIQHGLTELSLFGRHPCLSAWRSYDTLEWFRI